MRRKDGQRFRPYPLRRSQPFRNRGEAADRTAATRQCGLHLAKHTHAREAARRANAAARIHKYRQVGDALFRTQTAWSKTGDIRRAVASALNPAEMKTVAGLVNDPEVEAAINRDVKMGASLGVNGTPTMILTRKAQTYPISQFISYPIMAQFVDGLAKK